MNLIGGAEEWAAVLSVISMWLRKKGDKKLSSATW
jgi:hypothetical protein